MSSGSNGEDSSILDHVHGAMDNNILFFFPLYKRASIHMVLTAKTLAANVTPLGARKKCPKCTTDEKKRIAVRAKSKMRKRIIVSHNDE